VYWVSYNVYELAYPRPEMAAIRKVRCEVNTFVTDGHGRDGVYVFCGSPFVSREERRSVLGMLCDAAERLVIMLYGCGRLTRLRYELGEHTLRIDLDETDGQIALDVPLRPASGRRAERLSDDYHRFNDVSFFNGGKTYDLVTANSAFVLAGFESVELDPSNASPQAPAPVAGPFFRRWPDRVFVHRGSIGYLVTTLNRATRASEATP
jgi:hypothetical protein